MQAANHTVAGNSHPDKTKETPRDAVLKACTRVALTLIQSDKSVASLFKFGEPVFEQTPSKDRRTCKKTKEVASWAKTFTDRLGKDFLKLTVTNKMKCDDAADFVPNDWSKDGKAWHPKQAGVMYLNGVVCCTPRS
jgi:hypothetical protein